MDRNHVILLRNTLAACMISSSVVKRPMDMRKELFAASLPRPMEVNTCDGSMVAIHDALIITGEIILNICKPFFVV